MMVWSETLHVLHLAHQITCINFSPTRIVITQLVYLTFGSRLLEEVSPFIRVKHLSFKHGGKLWIAANKTTNVCQAHVHCSALALWAYWRFRETKGGKRVDKMTTCSGPAGRKGMIGAEDSLVPRPPVFDCLQYANMEGERVWRQVDRGLDTLGVVPEEESRIPFLYYQSAGWRPEC